MGVCTDQQLLGIERLFPESGQVLVVGEGAAPSRHAYLAFTEVYKTPLHGWCHPPFRRVVRGVRMS